MKLLDLTLASPEENLALDEALLEDAEAGQTDHDILRLWETNQTAVIIGRSSRIEQEVDTIYCAAHAIPVLRRCSGGAAVVIGPGCLMYSVILSYQRYPQLRMVDEAHQYVLGKVANAVRYFLPSARLQGISDLTLDDRKFSGNSLRCKRQHLLYHGTLLCSFPLELISRCLQTPPRQPDYRGRRSHAEFVANLGLSPAELRTALAEQWEAVEPLDTWPRSLTRRLASQRYASADWNLRY